MGAENVNLYLKTTNDVKFDFTPLSAKSNLCLISIRKQFEDVAYFEPFILKSIY